MTKPFVNLKTKLEDKVSEKILKASYSRCSAAHMLQKVRFYTSDEKRFCNKLCMTIIEKNEDIWIIKKPEKIEEHELIVAKNIMNFYFDAHVYSIFTPEYETHADWREKLIDSIHNIS